MKALVTGGAGFIGSNVVSLLLEKKWEVRVLDNLSSGYRKNVPEDRVEFVQGDIRNRDILDSAMHGIHSVFHLAASVGNSRSIANPQEDSEVNVLGTIKVMESAKKSHVATVVYSSSAAIFGALQQQSIGEDHPKNPDTPYGASKLGGEHQVLSLAKLYGMSAVCLRYFNVYGTGQRYDAYGNVIPIFARRILTGTPMTIFGDGKQTRDFVNVRDVAEANLRAATMIKGREVLNVGSGKSITIQTLAEIVQSAAGVQVGVEYAEPRAGDVLHCLADISNLRKTLDFTPTVDINDGIKEYLDWFKVDLKEPA